MNPMHSVRGMIARQVALGRWWPSLGGIDVATLRQWGWPAALGVALMVLSAAWRWGPLAQLEQATDHTLAQWQQARAAARAKRPAVRGVGADDRERFLASFPPLAVRQQRVAALLGLAQAQGLQVARAEFQSDGDPRPALDRQRVHLPLSGDYAALRAFIDTALQHDAALSLDGLRLAHPDDAGATVQAELQWSLWSRRGVARP